MWRCKWIEVQMNKLEAQHKEYGRKLEECKNTLLQGGEVRRVRRRKPTNDIEAYLSNHNIFSYYHHHPHHHPQKKKKNPAAADSFWGNGNDAEILVGGGGGEDNEQVLDHILEMIKGLHSRVVEMKSRVGKLTCQHSSSSSSMASYFASQLLSAAAAAAEEYDDDDILIDNHLVRDEMPCLKLEEQGKKKMLLLLHTDEED
ncbi:hypothetical protein ACS0TY_003557 [Phlomoides rotata]